MKAEKGKAENKAMDIYGKCYMACIEYTEEIQCSLQAKKCALICVEELINNAPVLSRMEGRTISYWQEVKSILEKL